MPQNARACYEADITRVALSSTASILGKLAANTDFGGRKWDAVKKAVRKQ